jgi:hypothetical protein
LSTQSDPKPGHYALDHRYWHLSTQVEALLRGFPQVLLLLDEEGKILDYRTGDPSLLFMPPDQFLQKNIRDVLPGDASDQVVRAVESARSTDQAAAFRCQLPTLGGMRWFDLRAIYTSDRHIVLAGRDISEQVSAVEGSRRQLQRVSSLHAIDSAAIASFDLKVILSVILREILNQLSVDAADVLLLDLQSNMLKFAAGLGFHSPGIQHAPIRLGQGYAGTAARERRTVSSSRLDYADLGNVSADEISREHFVSYYAVPLLAKGQIQGCWKSTAARRCRQRKTGWNFSTTWPPIPRLPSRAPGSSRNCRRKSSNSASRRIWPSRPGCGRWRSAGGRTASMSDAWQI